jgi:predicted transcriptional regulator
MLTLLAHNRRWFSVREIAEALALSAGRVSQTARRLHQVGLVEKRMEQPKGSGIQSQYRGADLARIAPTVADQPVKSSDAEDTTPT